MKKRIVAMLLVLAMALSLTPPVAFAATDAESAEGSYKVGYSKVDINPYQDYEDINNNLLAGLPMGGYEHTIDRLSNRDKLDDNGDGKIDENDGIFATCIAVTDKVGNTALLFSFDLLWPDGLFQTATLETLLKDEAFAEYNLNSDLIFFNGSHNHFAPTTNSTYANSEKYAFADQYSAWVEQVKNQLVVGAKAALEDRAWADMYKGSVDISDYFNENDGERRNEKVGDLLNKIRGNTSVTEKTYKELTGDVEEIFFNCVRQYEIIEQPIKTVNGVAVKDSSGNYIPVGNPITYVADDGTNGGIKSVGNLHTLYKYDENGVETSEVDEVRLIQSVKPVTVTDDKMHLVEFRFDSASKKEAVVMLNWRGHLPSTAQVSQDSTTGPYKDSYINKYKSYYQISSGMVNALRYALQLEGYRVGFFQGQGGNINMAVKGFAQCSWITTNDYKTETHTVYGTELAQIALYVLKNKMKPINEDGGEISGTRQNLQTERPTYTPFQYLAGLQYRTAYNATTAGIGTRVYRNLYYYEDVNGNPLIDTTNKQLMTDADGKLLTDPSTNATYVNADGTEIEVSDKVVCDKAVAISGIFQANAYADGYTKNGTAGDKMALCALTIGEDFSMVTAGTELFDRYTENGENMWDTMRTKNDAQLDGEKAFFVLGYTNLPAGDYLPAKEAYTYNQDSNTESYVVGIYESTRTRYGRGVGETVVHQLDVLLDFLKSDYEVTKPGADVCAHCGKQVAWIDLYKEVTEGELQFYPYLRTGHYYLSQDVSLTDMETAAGADVCINLNGKTLSVYKAIDVLADTTLGIMDSVGTGKVVGYEAPRLGGVFCAQTNATLNLYGGTLSYAGTPNPEQSSGGIVYVSGTFNMYDGLIEGTSVNHCGGAVHVETAGTANLRGGIIRGGTAKYGTTMTSSGTVLLAGDVEIENLYYLGQAHGLHFEGKFTGKVPYIGGIRTGVDVGDADENVDIYGAEWKMFGLWGYMPQLVKKETGGYDVYIQPMTDFVAKDKETEEYFYGYYTDQTSLTDELLLTDLLPDLSEGSEIKMMWPVNMPDTLTLNVNKGLHLDLNGKTVNGKIVVAENKTLYVSDSATADYDLTKDINNRERGHLIKSNITGNVVGAPATENSDVYMAVEESGNVYFHAVKLNIDQLVLRADYADENGSAQPGVYFKHQFAGDTTMAGLVESYGIAFSLVDAPTAQDLAADATELKSYVYKSGDVVYTQYGVEEFPYGETTAANTSTLITGIMKDTNTLSANKANAAMPIHGTAYIKLTTGEYILGVTRERSLQQQVEGIDTIWEMLSQTQRNGVLKMQKNSAFANVVKAWDLTNMTDGAKSQAPEEEKVLRVLSIGNSHTDNATEYLYNIFQEENPDQEVQIAQLYYSGCSISQHVNFAANNQAVYRYRTHDNRNPSGYSTMKQALQAEVWDVIILHDMNRPTATGDSFIGTNKRNLQKHINYVKNNSLNSDPTLIWNFSWANPTTETFWTSSDAEQQAFLTGWKDNYIKTHGPDIESMYGTMLNKMIANTKQYVMTNAAFADVAPTGLAFKYARDNNPNQEDPDVLLYCDYTHAGPGFGRLLAGYVWYATLTGQTQITELKYARDLTEDQQLLLINAVNHALDNKASLLP